MSPLLQAALVLHVVTGVGGVVALYALWMGLLKRTPVLERLRAWSFASLLFFVLSWLTGGYYYVTYYGKAVKPVIKAGDFPWAHAVFTEAKEHVFLFLPVLAAVLFLALLWGGDEIERSSALKRSLVFLAGAATIVGILVTLSGVVISGAVR